MNNNIWEWKNSWLNKDNDTWSNWINWTSWIDWLVKDTKDLINEIPNSEGNVEKIDYSKIRILIVDDNKTILTLLKIHLKKIWLEEKNIITLEDWEMALNHIKDCNSDYDIILMDRHMPNMWWDEASKKIKEIKPNIKIISITASNPENINVIYDDLLEKPINKELLEAMLEKNIRKPA